MTEGSTPALAELTIRTRGWTPIACAFSSLITTTAEAPSFMPEALPAVTVPVPSRKKAGFSLARPSIVQSSLGC